MPYFCKFAQFTDINQKYLWLLFLYITQEFTTEGVFMTEKIGDESVYLRISELKKGKIQFSDTTNAERFMREHGDVVRYN